MMNLSNVPDAFLDKMKAEDRKALGKAGVTVAEGVEAQESRSERELQKDIVGLLKVNGVKEVTASRMDRRTTNRVGTPDLIFCFRGIACAWEVKRPRQNLRESQIEVAKRMVDDGYVVAAIRSLQDAVNAIEWLIHVTETPGAKVMWPGQVLCLPASGRGCRAHSGDHLERVTRWEPPAPPPPDS